MLTDLQIPYCKQQSLSHQLEVKKVKNLFFTGQLTVPGPGVPPSLISGEVVAKTGFTNLRLIGCKGRHNSKL